MQKSRPLQAKKGFDQVVLELSYTSLIDASQELAAGKDFVPISQTRMPRPKDI
jgi:hypothetical protein